MSLLTRPRGRPEERDGHNPEFVRAKGDCLATWWQQATPGTSYWRCHVPAKYLPGQSLNVKTTDLEMDGDDVVFPRQRGGTAVWQFLGDNKRSRMALGLRALYGVRTLMEVDDNYTKAPPKRIRSTWADTIEGARTHFSGTGYSYEGNRVMAEEVDGIIVSTPWLGEVYGEFNDNIYVCPNSVDLDDWWCDREEHDAFRIVYYASQARYFDTPLVTKALKWAARQPGVEIWTVGVDPKDWSFPHQKIGWTYDLAEARKNLFKFDLGIAPVAKNDFALGKSDVKALEYAMAGVMPLVSRIEPYRPWFDKTDFVVADGDWEEAIRWAVRNQDDVREKAAEAKAYVLRDRTIESNIHLWREAMAA